MANDRPPADDRRYQYRIPVDRARGTTFYEPPHDITHRQAGPLAGGVNARGPAAAP
jgi:hypothetical protein